MKKIIVEIVLSGDLNPAVSCKNVLRYPLWKLTYSLHSYICVTKKPNRLLISLHIFMLGMFNILIDIDVNIYVIHKLNVLPKLPSSS